MVDIPRREIIVYDKNLDEIIALRIKPTLTLTDESNNNVLDILFGSKNTKEKP